MTELEKSAVIFFKCDLDLTFIYKVIQYGSWNVLTGLYTTFIWLDTVETSSKSDVRPPPPLERGILYGRPHRFQSKIYEVSGKAFCMLYKKS